MGYDALRDTPNRTIVELKLEQNADLALILQAPNRTIVELK